ncbi:hypothetical protein [Mesorhizobium sp. ESP7-2]|uniref:hypothetical protein n=1 Tax=Mesorhizobium sp. ESP7-2 TaxID=2876622 RepID=UPI001CCB9ECF|nr:hypothetical protein [Mesorhizobium sp. ESP7-2]
MARCAKTVEGAGRCAVIAKLEHPHPTSLREPTFSHKGRRENRVVRRQLTPAANRVKARFERDRFSMRGLSMALPAFDFPGHISEAGRVGASYSSTKTMAKTTTKAV